MRELRRIRKNQNIRDLVDTTGFNYKKLIQPLFIVEGLEKREAMSSLPGVYRDNYNSVLNQIESDMSFGVRHFLLFLVPQNKSNSIIPEKFYESVIGGIKKIFPDSFIWVDTCMCSLTTHGHCGLFNDKNEINTKSSVEMLSRIALSYARGGADGIAPSDMMDGRVKSHRAILDQNGFSEIPIMSYSTKFKSSFYGPFREAADSAPHFGDRSTYQLDVRNAYDSIACSVRDMEEGADLLMVKPGMTAIDLIRPIAEKTEMPVGAYQVSGEFASLALLAEKGLCNFEAALVETWQVFARAGSSYLITYAARRGNELLL